MDIRLVKKRECVGGLGLKVWNGRMEGSYLDREGWVGMEDVCFFKVWIIGKDLSGWGD